MSIRKLFWWSYLIIVHLAILFVLISIPELRRRFQMQQRLPGSRLSTEYDNRPDEWMRFIMHDGMRDPVVSIIDRPFGVEYICVAPPGSQSVWNFNRREGEGWRLHVADYGTPELAKRHFSNSFSGHVLVDGYPDGGADGFPDRESITTGGVRRVFTIEPVVRELEFEVPESSQP